MTETLTREEELRNDIDNLYFTKRYYLGVLTELEQLGRTHTEEFKDIERGIQIINHNIKRLEEELENEEKN